MSAAAPVITIPPSWDFQRDLLVCAGARVHSMIEAFAHLGQRRVLHYSTRYDPSLRRSESLHYTRVPSEVALFDGIQNIQGDDPVHAVVQWAPGEAHEPEELERLRRNVREAMSARTVNRNTLHLLGPVLAQQITQNLPEILAHPSIAVLRNEFQGVPCLIVSPGPSLAKNARLLPRARGRALIMAGTHTLPALRRLDVVPDLVCVTDTMHVDWHYADYDLSAIGAFVLGAAVHPALFAEPAPRFFTFAGNHHLEAWAYEGLPGNHALGCGGTVASSELALALAMGCDPVVFVGQDLALTDGRYYTPDVLDGASEVELAEDGSSFRLRRKLDYLGSLTKQAAKNPELRNRAQDLLEVPAWGGGMVRTTVVFSVYKSWLSALSQSWKGRARIYNASEGGAYIDGMIHEPLERVLEACLGPELPLRERIAGAAAKWDARAAREAAVTRLGSQIDSYREILLQTRRCDQLARKALSSPHALEALGQAERELSRATQRLPALSLATQREMHLAVKAATRATTLEENLRAAEQLFGIVRTRIEELLPHVERSHARLAAGAGARA